MRYFFVIFESFTHENEKWRNIFFDIILLTIQEQIVIV